MDDRMHSEAVATARQLLQRFKADHPEWTDDKTPVDELVTWYGLEVATFHPDDQPQGTYGWLEPGEDLIWLCRGLPETLRRFTLAHELGHAVLHRHADQAHLPEAKLSRDDLCQVVDVQEEITGLLDQDQVEEILGIGQSYDPRSQRELAANIFAAELLMPLERMQTLYLSLQTSPSSLASLFGVSAAAMLNRLAGLLNAPDDVWASPPHPTDAKELKDAPQAALMAPTPPATVKKRYDEFQQAAIEASAPALIVAGPGSGKTSTLIGRAEYVIRTLGNPPQHILALTFSRKAAQEMQERLQQALSDALTDNITPTVSTFHAFCADLLRTHGALVGLRSDFSLVDDAEGYFLLRRLAGELPLRHYQHLQFPTYYFPDILQAISRAKDELVTPEQYEHLARQMLEVAPRFIVGEHEEEQQKAEKALEVAAIYARYQAALQRRGDSDFGGLIMLATQLLEQYPEVLHEQQQHYQHILVDEFQDMNRASGVLLRLLAGEERRVWVVGDADQAIYRFRGASPANIGNFKDDYPGATVLPLNCNYRSRPDIVCVADAFRSKQLAADVQQGIRQIARPTQPDSYVTIATAADEAGELAGLVANMRYHQVHGYSYRDMVVLCRTRAQARKISQALAQAGLPVLERGGGSMLEQEHVRDLLSIVLLLAKPGGMGILRVARQREHTLTPGDIEALLLAAREQQCTPEALIVRGEIPATMSADGRRSLAHLAEILRVLGRMPDVWSMLAQYLFIETPIVRDLLSDAEHAQARQVRADYAAMLQLARHYDRQRQKEGEQEQQTLIANIQEQAKEFLDYLNVMLTLRQDTVSRQQVAESDSGDGPDSIRVLTVHASKGLEFPIVYLPGLVQRRFPLQARSSPISAPTGMVSTVNESETAHESGEACLFYVGVTRARDQLVLSYSERYGKQKYKPSPYLDALVDGLPAERITKLRWEGGATPPDPAGAINRAPTTSLPSSFMPRVSNHPYQPSERFIEAMKPAKVSISAIETYQICPRRYAYGNIYGFQREESAYQLFWRATQKTLEALQATNGQNESGETEPRWQTQQEVQDLYTQHWHALGGQELPFASIYEQHGREIVQSIWSLLTAGKDVNWELHRSFALEVAGTTIHVEVDRIERPVRGEQPVRFVRNRVGKSKEKPTAQVRELLYAQAYRQLYPGQSIEVHHHNLSTGELVSIKLTEKREQKLYDELEQAIRGMEQHAYPALPDSFVCPTCPFYLICPA